MGYFFEKKTDTTITNDFQKILHDSGANKTKCR